MTLKSFINVLLIVLLLSAAWLSSPVHAQTSRSLSGSIALDTGVANSDYLLDITVRNHSLVVIPPFFQIIRPITSSQSVRVVLPAGESQLLYEVGNIITDPVDYTIEISCQGCSNSIPTQYFSPNGNRFGLDNEVFIDPEDLPQTLSLTAITRATISGTITLESKLGAARDLVFELSVANAQNAQVIYQTKNVVLASGASELDYNLNGLPRETSGADYVVTLRCTNCFGPASKVQAFASTLSAAENHAGINFAVSGIDSFPLTAILDLLLSDNP